MTAAPRTARWLPLAALLTFVTLPCGLVGLTVCNLLRWTEAWVEGEALSARVAEIERRIRGLTSKPVPASDTGRIALAASSATLARAELQTRTVDLVERSGARLIEVRADDDAPDDPRGVTVRASFDTTQDRLVDLLAALEGSLPLLDVIGLDARIDQKREGLATSEDPRLRVTLTIRGFRRPEKP